MLLAQNKCNEFKIDNETLEIEHIHEGTKKNIDDENQQNMANIELKEKEFKLNNAKQLKELENDMEKSKNQKKRDERKLIETYKN